MKEERRWRKKEKDGRRTENRMDDTAEVTDTVWSEKGEIKMKNKRSRWTDWNSGVKVPGKKAIHLQSIDHQGSLSTQRHRASSVTHYTRSKSEARCQVLWSHYRDELLPACIMCQWENLVKRGYCFPLAWQQFKTKNILPYFQ